MIHSTELIFVCYNENNIQPCSELAELGLALQFYNTNYPVYPYSHLKILELELYIYHEVLSLKTPVGDLHHMINLKSCSGQVQY